MKQENERIKLIVNPWAGKAGQIKRILEAFEKQDIHPSVFRPKRKGQIRAAAKKASRKYDIVVACGGDGTINDVLNGIIGTKTKLGIVPLGTANSFANEIGISRNAGRTVALIKKGTSRKIDAGRINDRYFILCAGIGFDAKVITEVRPLLKNVFGGAVYPLTALKTLLKYRKPTINVEIDKKIYKCRALVVSNSRYYGGKIVISPDARVDDGYLNFNLFKSFGFFSLLGYTLNVLLGRKSRKVAYIRAKKAKITSAIPVLYHADAEFAGKTPAEVSILTKAVDVISG